MKLDKLHKTSRSSASGWVSIIGAVALIVSAIILGFTDGREGVIGDFLLNAGLFLGIQKFGNVAIRRTEAKYKQGSGEMGPPAGDGNDS